MVYPQYEIRRLPNTHMPESIKLDFFEADTIAKLSPRGAAALLRLALQKLCVHLGLPGKSLDSDIHALFKNGEDDHILQAMDIVRVVGNEAVHPGSMDIKDDHVTVDALFNLLNLVVEEKIGKYIKIAEIYKTLPEEKRKAIEERKNRS